MKGTTVILLSTLLLVAIACQLGSSIPTKSLHRKALSVFPVLMSRWLAFDPVMDSLNLVATGLYTIATGIDSIMGLVYSTLGWIVYSIQSFEGAVATILNVFGLSMLCWVVPVVTRTTVIVLVTLLFVPFKTVTGMVVCMLQGVYRVIRPFLIHYIVHFEYIESFVCNVCGAPGAIFSLFSGTGRVLSSGARGASNAASLAYGFAAAAMGGVSTMIGDTVSEFIKHANVTLTPGSMPAFNATEHYMIFQSGTPTDLPPPHLMNYVNLTANPISFPDHLDTHDIEGSTTASDEHDE